MAEDSFIYYRTPTSRQLDVADPVNLPDAQKWVFKDGDDIIEQIKGTYSNALKSIRPPTADGSRLARVTDNGFGPDGWKFTMMVNYLLSSAEGDTKLQAFRKIKQIDTYHIFGIFGISSPNLPARYNIDPTDLKGLAINGENDVWIGRSKDNETVNIDFQFFGTL